MFKTTMLVTALLFSVSAFSGTTTAKISQVLLYDTGNLIYVYPEGGLTDPAGCHTTGGQYYSFSAERSMAKEYLSALLSAQARQATVTLWGAGACRDQSNSETLRYLRIDN